MVKITRIREYLIRDTSELAAVLGRLIRKRLWLNDHQWLRHYYVIITNLMIRILRDLIGQIRPDLFWRKDVISYSGRPPSRLDFLWHNEIIRHNVALFVDESSRYDSLRNVRYRAISTMFSILVEILWSFINVILTGLCYVDFEVLFEGLQFVHWLHPNHVEVFSSSH